MRNNISTRRIIIKKKYIYAKHLEKLVAQIYINRGWTLASLLKKCDKFFINLNWIWAKSAVRQKLVVMVGYSPGVCVSKNDCNLPNTDAEGDTIYSTTTKNKTFPGM